MSLRPSVDWLLALVPIAIVLDRAAAAAPVVFLVAALAIVPLAALIVRSTEQVAGHTGPAVGGLLNAAFGNLPELIIAVAALRAGLGEMVRYVLLLTLGTAPLFAPAPTCSSSSWPSASSPPCSASPVGVSARSSCCWPPWPWHCAPPRRPQWVWAWRPAPMPLPAGRP
jgi:Sodium/calcium exchanger protein